jgi:hypothetical protein
MKCPKCGEGELRGLCWVPSERGAVLLSECPACHELHHEGSLRIASGQFPAASGDAAETPPATLRRAARGTGFR